MDRVILVEDPGGLVQGLLRLLQLLRGFYSLRVAPLFVRYAASPSPSRCATSTSFCAIRQLGFDPAFPDVPLIRPYTSKRVRPILSEMSLRGTARIGPVALALRRRVSRLPLRSLAGADPIFLALRVVADSDFGGLSDFPSVDFTPFVGPFFFSELTELTGVFLLCTVGGMILLH